MGQRGLPFLAAVSAAGMFLGAAPEARAGDEFEDAFKDELGRIAAYEAVGVGRGVLSHILLGGPPVYYTDGPYYPYYPYYLYYPTHRPHYYYYDYHGHHYRGHRGWHHGHHRPHWRGHHGHGWGHHRGHHGGHHRNGHHRGHGGRH
jgi:hypothetical protein